MSEGWVRAWVRNPKNGQRAHHYFLGEDVANWSADARFLGMTKERYLGWVVLSDIQIDVAVDLPTRIQMLDHVGKKHGDEKMKEVSDNAWSIDVREFLFGLACRLGTLRREWEQHDLPRLSHEDDLLERLSKVTMTPVDGKSRDETLEYHIGKAALNHWWALVEPTLENNPTSQRVQGFYQILSKAWADYGAGERAETVVNVQIPRLK